MAQLARCFSAFAAIALLVLVVQADEVKLDTPEKVAKAWLDAMLSGDAKAAMACLIKAEREDEEVQAEYKKLPKREKSAQLAYTLGKCEITGEKATVRADISSIPGEPNSIKPMVLVCAKEAGEWRIRHRETLLESIRANPEIVREARNSEVRAILVALEMRCRVAFANSNQAPKKISEAGMTLAEMEMEYWQVRDTFCISKDGRDMIIEAISKESDEQVLIRFNLVSGENVFLGMQAKLEDQASKKDAQTLLSKLGDSLRAQFAKTAAVPTTITGEPTTLTTYDLVGEYWIARNSVISKDNIVTITADSISEKLVATLEVDLNKGGGVVKYESAYTDKDLELWQQAKTRLEVIQQGLRDHHLANDSYPDSLSALDNKFASEKTPTNPFTDKNFDYIQTKDGFLVSCRGRDNQDGGRWLPDRDIEFNERGRVK